jgi:GxxExxY protein
MELEEQHEKMHEKGNRFNPIPAHTEEIVKVILDAAYQVHSAIGPGLLEAVYEVCMVHELKIRKINVESQVSLPVMYKGIKIDAGYRLDLLVDDCVIVEIKSSEMINPVHGARC